MLPGSKLSRNLFCAAILLVLGLASVKAARRAHKPYSPSAPEYRQKGAVDAKVVIVEFSDFQCPACAAALPTVKSLLALYGKDIKIVFKHFPLRMHPKAPEAARGAECAGRQGRFWEMHDLLFESQTEWSEAGPDWMAVYVKRLKLDEAAFAACIKDPATEASLAADISEGDGVWVGSTPTFFINGRRFAGGRQLSMRGTPWLEKQLKR